MVEITSSLIILRETKFKLFCCLVIMTITATGAFSPANLVVLPLKHLQLTEGKKPKN